MTFPRSAVAIGLLMLIFLAWYMWTSSPSYWLDTKVKEYDASEVWQIQHKGQPAYFIVAGCCDRYNPLLSSSGKEICNPSGGHEGGGDEKCPWPADPGTQATLIWPDAKANRGLIAPQLSKP